MARPSQGAGIVLFLFVTILASAAPAPRLVLDYVDDPSQLNIRNAAGVPVPTVEGMTVAPGVTLRTGATSAELKLVPNGSLVKLAPNTAFQVKSLQDLAGAPDTELSVLSGKIRMVAARLTGVNNRYTVFTPTAQAGVRGTDFAVEANTDSGDWICVAEGAVEFSLGTAGQKPGRSVLVKTKQFANAKVPGLPVKNASAADLADKFEGLDFVHSRPDAVPGHGN
jgi:hypothetical protein